MLSRISKIIPKNYAISVSLLGVMVFCSCLVFASKTSALYTDGRLIDDYYFLAANSMSQAEIQTFLVTKNSYLATYSSYSDRNSATVLASQIIYDAANDYGISPKVILATMQKEQSLVTDPDPDESQIKYAMGYGCPTSAGCGTSYPGFYSQVDNGAWQLKFNYERASGNNDWWRPGQAYLCASPSDFYSTGLYPGRSVNFIDEGGIVYKSFTIENAATASLYCYTPHVYPGSSSYYYSGSYNFVTMYELWFGSITGPRNGHLVKKINTPGAPIYLIESGTKRLFPSVEVFYSYRFTWSNVIDISEAEFNAIPDGATMISFNVNNRNGQLVKKANTTNAPIYIIENGKKRIFPSEEVFFSYGHTWNNVVVVDISEAEFNAIPDGATMTMNVDGQLVKKVNTPGAPIYFVESGTKRIFPSEEVFFSYGHTWNNVVVVDISEAEFNTIPDGATMISFNVNNRNGQLVKKTSMPSAPIYFVESGTKRIFPSEAVFYSYGYNWTNIISISKTEFDAIPDGATMIPFNVNNRNGQLVKKTSMPSAPIYFVESGTKRIFPSEAVFFSYGYRWTSVVDISEAEFSAIPDGIAMTMNK